MSTPRNFDRDLADSNDPRLLPMYEHAFRAYWKDYVGMQLNPKNNTGQRRGVDAILYLGRDKTVRVDFKHDKYAPNNYFLEFLSVDTTGAASWLIKEVSCDFFAYGFINHGLVDLIPADGLQLAWHTNGEFWKKKYGVKEVPNGRYKTHGVAVPVDEVWQAVVNVQCWRIPNAA